MKEKEKKEKIKFKDLLKCDEELELDPNVIEFEKEAKIQQEQSKLDQKNEKENCDFNEEDELIKENKKNRKKSSKFSAVAACFVLLLAIGIGGNWYLENSSIGEKIKPILSKEEIKTLGQAEFVDATTELKKENEYFTKARVDRQTARDEAIEKLQAVIDNKDSSKEESVNATNEIAKISKYISIENKIETLVCSKGVDNCLAVVSSDGTRIDIIVDLEKLNEQNIMQIKDVAIKQLGCSFNDVTIIQAKH